jgi:acyl-CoA reductase-like NAD-dependent aldehyde dehydrogenase
MVPRERGRLLARIADALEARVEELARTIAIETGNALRTQARPEAKTTVDLLGQPPQALRAHRRRAWQRPRCPCIIKSRG